MLNGSRVRATTSGMELLTMTSSLTTLYINSQPNMYKLRNPWFSITWENGASTAPCKATVCTQEFDQRTCGKGPGLPST